MFIITRTMSMKKYMVLFSIDINYSYTKCLNSKYEVKHAVSVSMRCSILRNGYVCIIGLESLRGGAGAGGESEVVFTTRWTPHVPCVPRRPRCSAFGIVSVVPLVLLAGRALSPPSLSLTKPRPGIQVTTAHALLLLQPVKCCCCHLLAHPQPNLLAPLSLRP